MKIKVVILLVFFVINYIIIISCTDNGSTDFDIMNDDTESYYCRNTEPNSPYSKGEYNNTEMSSVSKNNSLNSSSSFEKLYSSEVNYSLNDKELIGVSSCIFKKNESSSSFIDSSSNLLWADEFDGINLDESKWSYEIGNSGWGNNELQYYTKRKENIYVNEGLLHIVAKKESNEEAKYTSARIITKEKFDFTFGTIETRIALPAIKGIWPAFWMLGSNIDKVNWPFCGEIDIIESINDEHVIYGTNHWAFEGNHAEYGNSTRDYYGANKDLNIAEFHTYKLNWNKKAIAMYVDGFKYHEIDIHDTLSDMITFHKPFFMILNVAVGGSWPGYEIDDSKFPVEMVVDYIRVYND